MIKKRIYLSSLVVAFGLAVLPFSSQAFTVTRQVVSSDPLDIVTDVTDLMPTNPNSMGEEIVGYSYTAEAGSATYTADFTVSADNGDITTAPFMMAVGADISDFAVETLAADLFQYTVTFVSGDFYIPGEGKSPQFVFIFVPTVADPTPDNPEPGNGAPASMSGGFAAMTVQDFQIVAPTGPEDAQFGVSLTGPAGTSGFFKMKFPATMLALMGTMSQKTITAKDLALFVDNNQASVNVSETDDGGALLDIQITFIDDSTATEVAASTVTKEIVAKEKLELSSAFIDSTVKRSKIATFYGWKSANKANKKVKIYRKNSGGNFSLVDTVRTNAAGYYEYTFKAKKLALKAGDYVFKAVSGNDTSPKQTLTIQ